MTPEQTPEQDWVTAGDRVRVVKDVWDDHRERSWEGWEGVVESVDNHGPYPVYVRFPKARGKWRTYDFQFSELEVIAVEKGTVQEADG